MKFFFDFMFVVNIVFAGLMVLFVPLSLSMGHPYLAAFQFLCLVGNIYGAWLSWRNK